MKRMSFILLPWLLMAACENHSSEIDVNNSDLESYEIGKMHNEVLAYYASKSPNYHYPDEAISVIRDYLVEEKKYDNKVVDLCIKEITGTPEYNSLFTTKSVTEDFDLDIYLKEVEMHFKPSEEIMTIIKRAFELGECSTPEVVRDFVIQHLQSRRWTNVDKDLAYVFSDVLLNSYYYWTTTDSESKKLKKSSLVILYDAGGALHGLIFGPVGSIIEGALVSVAANERIPDDD